MKWLTSRANNVLTCLFLVGSAPAQALTLRIIVQAAEAVAGATGAEEAEAGPGAEAWAGAAEAGAEALWETTQRTKTTSMRTRWM